MATRQEITGATKLLDTREAKENPGARAPKMSPADIRNEVIAGLLPYGASLNGTNNITRGEKILSVALDIRAAKNRFAFVSNAGQTLADYPTNNIRAGVSDFVEKFWFWKKGAQENPGPGLMADYTIFMQYNDPAEVEGPIGSVAVVDRIRGEQAAIEAVKTFRRGAQLTGSKNYYWYQWAGAPMPAQENPTAADYPNIEAAVVGAQRQLRAGRIVDRGGDVISVYSETPEGYIEHKLFRRGGGLHWELQGRPVTEAPRDARLIWQWEEQREGAPPMRIAAEGSGFPYVVMYVGYPADGALRTIAKELMRVSSIQEAERWVKRLKPRTAWIEDEQGNHVPVKGAMRRGPSRPSGEPWPPKAGEEYGTHLGWAHRREKEEAVVVNIPPHLQALWQRIKRQFKGTPEERLEKFLQYAHEHEGEVMTALQDEADATVARMIYDYETEIEPSSGIPSFPDWMPGDEPQPTAVVRENPVEIEGDNPSGSPCDVDSPTACIPWVKVTRDPERYQECVERAKAIGELNNARKIYDLLSPALAVEDQEVFVVVLLDVRTQLRGVAEVHRGSRSRVSVSVPDIMRVVIASGAEAFAVVHNHPTGKAEPSDADKDLTKSIKEAAELFKPDLSFVDHVVIGLDEYYSFTKSGYDGEVTYIRAKKRLM